MTVQATAGVGVAGIALVAVGSDPGVPADPPTLVAGVSHELARTGATGTYTLVALAVFLIIAGLLVLGAVHRHRLRQPPPQHRRPGWPDLPQP